VEDNIHILSINESREQRNVAGLLVIFTAKVGFGAVALLQTSQKALFRLPIRVLHVRAIFCFCSVMNFFPNLLMNVLAVTLKLFKCRM
jgi:hypothetical protein